MVTKLLPRQMLGKMVKRHGRFNQYIGIIPVYLCADPKGSGAAMPAPTIEEE